MWPLYGNTKPGVAASPSAGADEQVGFAHPFLSVSRRVASVDEVAVDVFYLVSNCRVVVGSVVFGFHIYHIFHLVKHAVPDGTVRAQDAILVGHLCQVFVQLHAIVHHGTYL